MVTNGFDGVDCRLGIFSQRIEVVPYNVDAGLDMVGKLPRKQPSELIDLLQNLSGVIPYLSGVVLDLARNHAESDSVCLYGLGYKTTYMVRWMMKIA